MEQRRNNRRKKGLLSLSCIFGVLLGIVITLSFLLWYYALVLDTSITNRSSSNRNNFYESQNELLSVEKCTLEQKVSIVSQLIPHFCVSNQYTPWHKRCSFTVATSCPEPTWLSDYYSDMGSGSSPRFIGISVGCNKGFDAINTLRMGTFDDSFDKGKWRDEMNIADLSGGVCSQMLTGQFQLHDQMKARKISGEMHCIEPLPINYEALERSSRKLGYDTKGFVVRNIAISNKNGKIKFASGKNHEVGVENLGLDYCKDSTAHCIDVNVLTLDSYVDKFVSNYGPIHSLSIDVEGYDFDVLRGALKTLSRVDYLEFEYNWMGSWKDQHLHDAIQLLDSHGMTCYWAGIDSLWRITGCWLNYFDTHHWSNVACVKRSNAILARRMEEKFLETLTKENRWYPKEETAGRNLIAAMHRIAGKYSENDPGFIVTDNGHQYRIKHNRQGDIYLDKQAK